ncbi:MAG TPA: circadian clock protein KaiC [Acidimicrobiales bacterium]|jgi:circadian clock protein KaiC|nr:circadian clock protein KaiC [Acidimicrobiales bacterium]
MPTLHHEVDRVEDGIPGLDLITHGGLPRDRLTLVAGTAGSGQTVFAAQFLATGVAAGEPGVFVTFEERPHALRRNMLAFGWDIESWEAAGSWAFVDASPRHDIDTVFTGGDYDLGPLLDRIASVIAGIGAKRVAIDSVGALVAQFDKVAPARQALFQMASALESAGVTTVMTAERLEDYGPIAKLGFEEFVADNVVILRNALDGEKRRRTIEVLKMRGCSHLKGEHLFTLLEDGIVVVPVAIASIGYRASTERLSTGVGPLDEMFHGGLFKRSLWLVAGPTGTGKSFLAAHFVGGGVRAGERALLHSFEESRDQLIRNAAAWGLDLASMEADGKLCIVAEAPEAASLEDHLQRMKATIEEFRPDRVAIDSLTALQRISTVKSFREYVLGLTLHMKLNSMLGMVTSSVNRFLTADAASDLHVSTISDAITLLHYVPVAGEMRRGVQVLKMRGSDHDRAVREFRMTDRSMEIGEPFEAIEELF